MFGYTPRPAHDPHVGIRYALGTDQKARLNALGVIDLLPKCPPNRFQDRLGSCTGQGFGHASHYLMKQAAADGLLPDCYSPASLAIYAWERELAGTFGEDSGSTLANGVATVQDKGIPREDDWPYDESRVFVEPSEATVEHAALRKVVNSHPLMHDLDDIRHALSMDCPVVVGIPCYESIFSPETSATGIVPEPEPGESIAGWHCVVVYKHDPFKHQFSFKNWWQGWGIDNVGILSDDYLISRANEMYALGAVR